MIREANITTFGQLRHRFILTCLIMAFGASDAMAQSSTNCMIMGRDMVHCDTTNMGQTTRPDYNIPGVEGSEALGRGIGMLMARNRENSIRKKVGQMLAQGDCKGAANYAYAKGRLELGSSIAQSCR